MINLATLGEWVKSIIQVSVIAGLVITGFYLFYVGNTTDGAWALGLAGGYGFKNGASVVNNKRKAEAE